MTDFDRIRSQIPIPIPIGLGLIGRTIDRSIHVSVFGSEDGIESARRRTVFDLRLCTLQYKFYLHNPSTLPTDLYNPGTCSTGIVWCGSGKERNQLVDRISSQFRIFISLQLLFHSFVSLLDL